MCFWHGVLYPFTRDLKVYHYLPYLCINKTNERIKDYMEYTVPIKMPRGTHYGSNYYEFLSRKLKRIVTAFSSLEYWNQICLEMDYNVEKYCEQPIETEVFFDGKIHKTVFDVWVKYKDGREEFQEVKMAEELENETAVSGRSYKQIAIQKAWCEQNGKKYVVRTDRDIILGTHFIRNLLYLYPKVLRIESTDSVAEKHILKFIDERETVTVGQLINGGIISSQNGIDILANLYYKGELCFSDLATEPFGFSMEVRING